MKRVCLSVLFTAIVYCNGFGQGRVHLLVNYLPKHLYVEKTDQITNLEMELTGSFDTLQNPDGAKEPVKKHVMVHSEKETSTGKLYDDSLFAIKTVLTKMQNGEGTSPIPPGSIIYSTGRKSGRVTVDSMSAEGMDPELKEKLFPLLQNVIHQITVPEHTIKTGESFSFKTPLALPLSGMTLDFIINTTYKLKNISSGIAYFDISQDYAMNSESVAVPIKATGTGSGTMSYDINNNYFTEYESNNTISMSANMEGRGMKMVIESTTIQKVKISSN